VKFTLFLRDLVWGIKMIGDEYITSILSKYRVITGDGSATYKEREALLPVIRNWAGSYLLSVAFSGSYAKGTGVKGSTDVDLFISLDPQTPRSLKEIYDNLYTYLSEKRYAPRRQNVSIGLDHNDLSVDLTPGKKQAGNTNYHSIFRSKAQTWTQTNIEAHIDLVKQSGRIDEIRAIKIWRNLHQIEFPSFYLELIVLEALHGRSKDQLAANVLSVLEHIRDRIVYSKVIDPANSNNIVSDDLSPAEKQTVASVASASRSKQTWGEIIW
jgi:hypothetical protein